LGGLGSGRPPDEARRREAARLRAEGLSLVEIGRRLGVTRQRVEQIFRAIERESERRLTCRTCGGAVAPPGAALNDVTDVLCLACLSQLHEATLAERLRSCRTAAGLRLKDLAVQVGVTVDTLRGYESGAREPRWQQVARLVRVLGPTLLPLGLAGPVEPEPPSSTSMDRERREETA